MRYSALIVLAAGLTSLWGCAHSMERRVVQAFADSLQKENLEALRERSSDKFESKALDHQASLDTLKTLDIPAGKTKVVKVQDDSETEKRVTVEVGESKRKILYKLQRDPHTRKWVVDDIYLNKKELADRKSVSSQAHIMLSLRTFLDAWESGDRNLVLASVTPEFGQVLSDLPPTHLAQMARKLTAEVAAQERLRPNLELRDERANVRFPKLDGELHISFVKAGEHWKAEDLSVVSRREGQSIDSVRRMAAASQVALTFHTAYTNADKRTLQDVSAPHFFDGVLDVADLSQVRLPPIAADASNIEVKLEGNAGAFVINSESEIVKLSLSALPQEREQDLPRFHVDEVTIFELNGNQNKRLTALFSSHAMMQVFAEALTRRDLKALQLSSTRDFSKRVWERLNDATLARMPMGEIHSGEPQIVTTQFQGPVTQILVNQGAGPLTYVLRDQAGKLLVDDVLVPAAERPESLKTSFELLIPLMDFAQGLAESDVSIVRANASRDFCRLVWNQVDVVPLMDRSPHEFLQAGVNKVVLTADRVLVVLGDERFGAKVLLIKEREQYVVDDVVMISGPEADQRVGLKKTLRVVLAQRGL